MCLHGERRKAPRDSSAQRAISSSIIPKKEVLNRVVGISKVLILPIVEIACEFTRGSKREDTSFELLLGTDKCGRVYDGKEKMGNEQPDL